MKNTERFSNRVANYVSYRPSYPKALVSALKEKCGLEDNSVIADIGSGTGKLTELLLDEHYRVFAVEPNKEMREAAETLLSKNSKFTSVAGESSATGVANQSVDLIVAAQAFHWFDPEPTRVEFERILKPEGVIALVWNERDTTSSFQKEYDRMLANNCPEYSNVNHRNISDDDIEAFFHPKGVGRFSFPYSQSFDESSFLGRMFSSSYTPEQNTPDGERLSDVAKELFSTHAANGIVEFSYQTNLYLSGDLPHHG